MKSVVVQAGFDDLKCRDMRLLEEAARLGAVHVLLLSDEAIEQRTGAPPKFTQPERRYFVEAIRYVDRVTCLEGPIDPDGLAAEHSAAATTWAVEEADDTAGKRAFCREHGIQYHVIAEAELEGYPDAPEDPATPSEDKKVLVTGCYDWFHSGHVRFFEEVSELGDLYVVVGHDDNIKLLKGEGHPMFPDVQRRYMAGSIRHVKKALISSGHGWLDAEPQIEEIRPDIYAVNEDGDQPEKRDYCEKHGIEYRILKRLPKEGLPKRQSTDLRGF